MSPDEYKIRIKALESIFSTIDLVDLDALGLEAARRRDDDNGRMIAKVKMIRKYIMDEPEKESGLTVEKVREAIEGLRP